MATPTGQISLGDCNVEIMQRGFGAQIQIWEPGDRLSYSGQRDMAALRKAWGATLTDGVDNQGKFGSWFGYYSGVMGSINDNTINNSGPLVYCSAIYWTTFLNLGSTIMDNPLASQTPVAGFNGTDVDHFSVNFSRKNITARGTASFNWIGQQYFDGSATEIIGLKFYA